MGRLHMAIHNNCRASIHPRQGFHAEYHGTVHRGWGLGVQALVSWQSPVTT